MTTELISVKQGHSAYIARILKLFYGVLEGKFAHLLFLTVFSASTHATPYLWQANVLGNDIYIYNLDNFELVHRLEVGPNPHGIATTADNRVLYVSLEKHGQTQGELLWINPTRLEIERRIPTCREPQNIATTPDGKWLYVPCNNGHYWVIDTKSGKTVKKIKTGGRPHNTEASHDGRYMYLSPLGGPKGVTIVDVSANHEVIGFIPFGGEVKPLSLSQDGQLLFQQVEGVIGFKVADTKRQTVISTVESHAPMARSRPVKDLINRISKGLGFKKVFHLAHCHGIEVRPDQKEVWSTCGNNLNIHALERGSYTETAHLSLDGNGYWLAFSPDSRFCAVALANRDQVAIVDTIGKNIIRLLNTGRGPRRNIIIEHSIEQ